MQSIPLEVQDVISIDRNSQLKITAAEHTTIPAGGKTALLLQIKGEGLGDTEDYAVVQNAHFLAPRGLYFQREKKNRQRFRGYLHSQFHQDVKIFKGTTLAFLVSSAESPIEELLTLDSTTNDDAASEVVDTDHAISKDLNSQEKDALLNLLMSYKQVFAKSPSKLGRTHLTEFGIDVEGALPIRSRPYRVSQLERDVIRQQIDEMLRNDIIRPSKSPWSSPIVLAKKKDGKLRFCVDYRRLNDVTRKSAYFIPTIDDLLTYLGGAKYYSTLDLGSGYWQLPIKESSRDYTAFASHEGLYEFNVLPFGLCNAPAQFIQFLDILFAEEKFKDILLYVDDIIIFSKTFEEHLDKLKRVFEKLSYAGLTLNPKKCIYLEKEVKLLGHKVSTKGILVDHKKIEEIVNFPVPRNVKQLQSFIGLSNFYRKFIKDFAATARPLHEATKTTTGFVWGDEQ